MRSSVHFPKEIRLWRCGSVVCILPLEMFSSNWAWTAAFCASHTRSRFCLGKPRRIAATPHTVASSFPQDLACGCKIQASQVHICVYIPYCYNLLKASFLLKRSADLLKHVCDVTESNRLRTSLGYIYSQVPALCLSLFSCVALPLRHVVREPRLRAGESKYARHPPQLSCKKGLV